MAHCSGDLLGLDESLDGMRGRDDVVQDALLGESVRLRLRLDLALVQLLANKAGANRHRGDAVLGAFRCQRLHESEDAVLCGT